MNEHRLIQRACQGDPAAERAISLNPRDSDAMAMIGVMTAYTGDWERGLELSARAMALNPNHPGWYRFAAFFDLYRQSRFEEALDVVERINLPDYFPHAYCRAMTHAQLGHPDEATRALHDLIALWPDVSLAALREIAMDRWMYAQPELVELARSLDVELTPGNFCQTSSWLLAGIW